MEEGRRQEYASNSLLLIITSSEMVITRSWRWNRSNCMRREKKVSGEGDREGWRECPQHRWIDEVTFHALSESANSIALWNPDADSAYWNDPHDRFDLTSFMEFLELRSSLWLFANFRETLYVFLRDSGEWKNLYVI